jgi:hypothetical protein
MAMRLFTALRRTTANPVCGLQDLQWFARFCIELATNLLLD